MIKDPNKEKGKGRRAKKKPTVQTSCIIKQMTKMVKQKITK